METKMERSSSMPISPRDETTMPSKQPLSGEAGSARINDKENINSTDNNDADDDLVKEYGWFIIDSHRMPLVTFQGSLYVPCAAFRKVVGMPRLALRTIQLHYNSIFRRFKSGRWQAFLHKTPQLRARDVWWVRLCKTIVLCSANPDRVSVWLNKIPTTESGDLIIPRDHLEILMGADLSPKSKARLIESATFLATPVTTTTTPVTTTVNGNKKRHHDEMSIHEDADMHGDGHGLGGSGFGGKPKIKRSCREHTEAENIVVRPAVHEESKGITHDRGSTVPLDVKANAVIVGESERLMDSVVPTSKEIKDETPNSKTDTKACQTDSRLELPSRMLAAPEKTSMLEGQSTAVSSICDDKSAPSIIHLPPLVKLFSISTPPVSTPPFSTPPSLDKVLPRGTNPVQSIATSSSIKSVTAAAAAAAVPSHASSGEPLPPAFREMLNFKLPLRAWITSNLNWNVSTTLNAEGKAGAVVLHYYKSTYTSPQLCLGFRPSPRPFLVCDLRLHEDMDIRGAYIFGLIWSDHPLCSRRCSFLTLDEVINTWTSVIDRIPNDIEPLLPVDMFGRFPGPYTRTVILQRVFSKAFYSQMAEGYFRPKDRRWEPGYTIEWSPKAQLVHPKRGVATYILNDLHKDVTCPVCKSKYQISNLELEPISLTCGHIICRGCLREAVKGMVVTAENIIRFKCQSCEGKECIIPSKVEWIVPNYGLISIIATLTKHGLYT